MDVAYANIGLHDAGIYVRRSLHRHYFNNKRRKITYWATKQAVKTVNRTEGLSGTIRVQNVEQRETISISRTSPVGLTTLTSRDNNWSSALELYAAGRGRRCNLWYHVFICSPKRIVRCFLTAAPPHPQCLVVAALLGPETAPVPAAPVPAAPVPAAPVPLSAAVPVPSSPFATWVA